MIDDVGEGWYFHENYYDKWSIVEVEGIQERDMETPTRVMAAQNGSRKSWRSIRNRWRRDPEAGR